MDKKEKILLTALELFANNGYSATATSKIAKQAGVSEGLIFRHFENKKGLLDAIFTQGSEKLAETLTPIITETDPHEVIRKTIGLPFKADIIDEEIDFWKLQFKLKWDQEYNVPEKMKPLLDKLTAAFDELGYDFPEKEARLLNQIVEAASTERLRGDMEDPETYEAFLLKKYNCQ
ncbi:MAG: TetR/AcrR family transcriptional regulator [Bacteroidota bacterium]